MPSRPLVKRALAPGKRDCVYREDDKVRNDMIFEYEALVIRFPEASEAGITPDRRKVEEWRTRVVSQCLHAERGATLVARWLPQRRYLSFADEKLATLELDEDGVFEWNKWWPSCGGKAYQ